ncbi:TM2 domain-containing protein [Listeria sp. FSL L7-0233]|uniref:TM2 domain-containing protein n=1 Tax=Listeria cossartiae TaxID=2838249 RepID=UPI001623F792|nr:TM2 domain-containing protein [Listeria cossartiae]MBC1542958.1 TM2 domain-containing protein [Listeria cossartiae subsp. cossartiae]MBC1568041.1 TM2 domain-containing protein [Listeria cossartiae subsp. cossartiae]MBC2182938.1 TM2 domain-containing protein [Listeria cossartiae subsp. cossartiae]MBC2185328.1 TM2 domain-containing protein [Listeria cossartiae subsp. cossartiae]MBC2190861.1 TM2 domain-containing protein [Listeria cossartiae subsp. cossartiae]
MSKKVVGFGDVYELGFQPLNDKERWKMEESFKRQIGMEVSSDGKFVVISDTGNRYAKLKPIENNGLTYEEQEYVKETLHTADLKSKSTAVLLSLFFGGLGIGHFYTGNWIYGLIILIGSVSLFFLLGFLWIPILLVLTFIDCFVVASEVTSANEKIKRQLISQIKLQKLTNRA